MVYISSVQLGLFSLKDVALRLFNSFCLFIFAFDWYVLRWSLARQLHAGHRAVRSFIFVIQGFRAFPVSSCVPRAPGRWDWGSGLHLTTQFHGKSLCPRRSDPEYVTL